MLNGDSMFLSSRQSAATDVIAKSSTPTIPVKFRNDIETLKDIMPKTSVRGWRFA